MIHAWTPQYIRDAEQPFLGDGQGEALMARAAAALAAVCLRELETGAGGRQATVVCGTDNAADSPATRAYGSRVVLLVGKGNNGGDALYAGRRLAARGVRVDAVLVSGDAHAGGLAAARDSGVRIHELGTDLEPAVSLMCAANVLIDGIVGTGARAGLRSPARELIESWQQSRRTPGARVIAVDVPSGIGAGGETSRAHLPADVTVTFAGAKTSLLLPPAAAAAGAVEVVDIGIPLAREDADAARLTPPDIAAMWPVPGADDHKYTRGVLGIVAGSARYPGAAVLATAGARAAGAGMIRYMGPDAVAAAVNSAFPEVVPGPGRVQAWLLGPGIDPSDDDRMGTVRRLLREAGDTQTPCIVDAGALAAVDRAAPDSAPPMILTPHAGELATLMSRLGASRAGSDDAGSDDVSRDDVEAAPADWARRAAQVTGAVVALKGAVTVIAQPHGPTYAQADAPPWLATAGAGDVLAGIVGAVTATSCESSRPAVNTGKSLPALAADAALGVMTHGLAAARASGGGPIAAGDVAAAVPAVVAEHRACRHGLRK